MQIIEIPLERLTAEAFTPYGWVLSAKGPPDYARPGLENWRLPYSSDASLRLQIMRYSVGDMVLSMVERHLCVTEARMPMGDAPAVLVVAGDPSQDGPPTADSLRAFYLDGATGIMFRKGVWHGLDCFPARGGHVDYLFLSDSATEDEIEALPGALTGIRTEVHDFSNEATFQVVDPVGLLQ